MADDNVTDLPGQNGGGNSGKPKPAKSVLAEVRAQFLNKKAGDFKTKAAAKMEEIEKLKVSLALAEKQLADIIAEYEASVSV